jgi:hypothetical protein
MECRLAGETEVLGENLPQRHFCPSQNPTWPEPTLYMKTFAPAHGYMNETVRIHEKARLMPIYFFYKSWGSEDFHMKWNFRRCYLVTLWADGLIYWRQAWVARPFRKLCAVGSTASKLNSVAVVRKRTIPTDRRLWAKLVPTFAGITENLEAHSPVRAVALCPNMIPLYIVAIASMAHTGGRGAVFSRSRTFIQFIIAFTDPFQLLAIHILNISCISAINFDFLQKSVDGGR